MFFSVKINISITGGFRVGFLSTWYQPPILWGSMSRFAIRGPPMANFDMEPLRIMGDWYYSAKMGNSGLPLWKYDFLQKKTQMFQINDDLDNIKYQCFKLNWILFQSHLRTFFFKCHEWQAFCCNFSASKLWSQIFVEIFRAGRQLVSLRSGTEILAPSETL